MSKKVLVIAAHTDDEALGCGATIAKHAKNGDEVHLLFMTDGVSSRNSNENEVMERLNAAQKAAKNLQVKSLTNLNFPDNLMDTVPLLEIVKEIEKTIHELKPQIIFTHHIGDLNVDHQVTHRAVMTACRPQPDFCVDEIYAFEVLSSSEWQTPGCSPFIPNVFVDVTGCINLKLEALSAYEVEMRLSPHSRSIENVINLAKIRGNTVGVEYAEAFILIRAIK